MHSQDIVKRVGDLLEILIMSTVWCFSVEHRLPKVQHWTPFDIYATPDQAPMVLILLIHLCFVAVVILNQAGGGPRVVQETDHLLLAGLAIVWVLMNAGTVVYGYVKCRERTRCEARLKPPDTTSLSFRSPSALVTTHRVCVKSFADLEEQAAEDATEDANNLHIVKPWDPAAAGSADDNPQVVSIASQIRPVRNVDLVTAIFECKVRVFSNSLTNG